MGSYRLQKDLVFFHPGKHGQVFTCKVGTPMTEKILRQILDHLTHVTEKKVDWIEERRRLHR